MLLLWFVGIRGVSFVQQTVDVLDVGTLVNRKISKPAKVAVTLLSWSNHSLLW